MSTVSANEFALVLLDTGKFIEKDTARAISRNLADFWLIEARMRKYNVLVCKTIDEAFLKAQDLGVKYLICSDLGSFFSGETEFLEKLLSWVSDHKTFYFLGNTNPLGTAYDPCFVLNLQEYKQIAPLRWPDDALDARNALQRVNAYLIQKGEEFQKRIYDFPEELRRAKIYFHPVDSDLFLKKLATWENMCNFSQRAFYVFNTERVKLLPPQNQPFRPLGRLITLCSGLLFFEVLRHFEFYPETSINFYDASIPAMNMMRKLMTEWDGRNYPDFIFNNKSPDIVLFNYFQPEEKWKEFMDRFGGEEQWMTFFHKVKSNCDFFFSEANVYEEFFYDRPYFDDYPEDFESLLWLSNVFHYRYTSTLRSLEDRIRSQDHLLLKLKEKSPRLLIHMATALGNRPNMDTGIFRAEQYQPQIEFLPSFWK